MQCVHQTVDLHYAIAKGTRVYPIENSIEVRDIIITERIYFTCKKSS